MNPPKQQRPEASSTMHGSRTLTAEVEQINVGSGSTDTGQREAPSTPESASAKPVPLGTYVPPDLKRAFKARCAELGIEMKHGVAEALTDWLATHPASQQAD